MTTDYFQFFRNNTIFSKYLGRVVIFDLIVPKNVSKANSLPTLYMNDGQDLDKLAPQQMLTKHYKSGGKPFVWVSIHTNERRLQEYGTAHISDYKNRGVLATKHMKFVINELMPHVQRKTPSSLKADDNYYCGFSLGGLSALDTVWENPTLFSKVGAFSGSFWWRSKSYEDGYDDNDRIIHNKIKDGGYKPGLKFWFECGTKDEEEDRNNNGVIDSIEDTLDLINELHLLGYKYEDTTYVEILGGEHNFNTWQACFYDFVVWALKD